MLCVGISLCYILQSTRNFERKIMWCMEFHEQIGFFTTVQLFCPLSLPIKRSFYIHANAFTYYSKKYFCIYFF